MADPGESIKYRLNEDLIARIRAYRHGWPKRDDFVHWYREIRQHQGSLERNWKRLEGGEGVPLKIAQGFVDYLREVRGWGDLRFETACRPVVPGESRDEDGVWRNWRSIFHALTGRFRDCPEMYAASEEDCLAASRIVVQCIGYKYARPGESLDEVSCLERGVGIFRRSVEDYASWLAAMWRKERRAVMFAVVPRRRGGREVRQRVGVSVVLPLVERAFRQFTSGEISDEELGPEDLETPSRYAFLHAIGQMNRLSGFTVRERTRAEAHAVLYQLACLTYGIRPFRPVVVSVLTNPQYERRLRRMGYRENGARVPGTNVPVVLLRPPREVEEPTMRERYSYRVFTTALSFYQDVNRGLWRRERRQG